MNYFAAHHDDAAYNAELRRLKVQFPGWDPSQGVSDKKVAKGPDDNAIYQLIADGRYAEASAAITQAKAQFPDWNEPTDMKRLLSTGKSQKAFDDAIQAKDLRSAIAAVTAAPQIMSCDRVNNPWRLADLERANKRNKEALSILQSVVQRCSTYKFVYATLQKASVFASKTEMAALFKIAEQRFPAKNAELVKLQKNSGPVPAAGTAGARTARVAPAAPTISTNDISCLSRTRHPRSPTQKAQRAWCVYNFDRPLEALNLFREVVAHPGDSRTYRDARYGMAMVMLKLHMSEQAAEVAAGTHFTLKQQRDVEMMILDQRSVDAFHNGNYAQSIAYVDAYEKLSGAKRRDLEILRAYALAKMGHRKEAHAIFRGLNAQLSTANVRQGLNATR